MEDPVMTKYGHLYERAAIVQWINDRGTDPLTNLELTINDIFPAIQVRNAIAEYKKMKEKK